MSARFPGVDLETQRLFEEIEDREEWEQRFREPQESVKAPVKIPGYIFDHVTMENVKDVLELMHKGRFGRWTRNLK